MLLFFIGRLLRWTTSLINPFDSDKNELGEIIDVSGLLLFYTILTVITLSWFEIYAKILV